MWDTVREFESIGNRTLMGLLLLIVIVLIVGAFYMANKADNKFRIVDAVMQSDKASLVLIILLGSWVIHSWVLVSWVMNGAATLADLATYGGTWVTPSLAAMYVSSRQPPKE